MGKARFGVSVDEELARSLDRLAEALGGSRSEVVEHVLREGLSRLEHAVEDHECHGLVIVMGDEGRSQEVFEEFSDFLGTGLHYHVGRQCVSLAVFRGPSGVLRRILSRLMGLGARFSFVPLH